MSAFGGKADMMRTCCLDIGVNGQELLGKAQTVEIKERLLPQQQKMGPAMDARGVVDTAVSWQVVRNMIL
jgi:hypothetical protein